MSLELIKELEAEKKPEKESSPFLGFLLLCVAITLVAAGAGFGVGATVLKPSAATVIVAEGQAVQQDAAPVLDDASGVSEAESGSDGVPSVPHGTLSTLPEDLTVVDIAPITTNLLDPEDVWIRMELSLAYDGAADDAISEEVHQDILAYVHTLKLYNLRGGSGFQHLMEDLNERAAIRSGGRVRRVLVRSFILE